MLLIDDALKNTFQPKELGLMNQRSAEFDALIAQYGKPFAPHAIYDDQLDCIRVVVKDCSTTEFRVTPNLTVLIENDPASIPCPVGFNVKGVKAGLGRSAGRALRLRDYFDELVRVHPEESVRGWVALLQKMVHLHKLEDQLLEPATS